MKTLQDILYKAGVSTLMGNAATEVNALVFDSRLVAAGCAFVALRGEQADGHKFIDRAITAGAVAVVCEEIPENLEEGITYVQVADTHLALGVMASNFYENPSEGLKLIGITGTNGKTTTVTMLYNLFTALGYACGLISTIRIVVKDRVIPTTHTTPDAVKLNSILREMLDEGVTHCFMEVSSHAVVQHRISGLHFSGGAFSNITHDHLDYHKTFADYIAAKKGFFDMLPASAFALSNTDDRNGGVMLQNTKASKYYYGLQKPADYKCRIIESHFSGTLLHINGSEVWMQLIGNFNAYNALATYAVAVLSGEEKDQVLRIMSTLQGAEGRFEHFKNNTDITGIVDYAHTPDALINVLGTINALRTHNENLITVVGCGGNRDRKKRPEMARIAAENSSILIITSDNPRDEDPEAIIEEMMQGIDPVEARKTTCITDRKQAIRTACMMAKAGDIILVAGKGHEKYQEIKGVKYPFDDMTFLKEFLTEKM